MIGDSPMGPFTYGGVAFPNTSAFGFGGGNNHHCLFSFRDQWYITYHTLLVWKGVQDKNGQYYRSTSIDKLEYNSDGGIITITGTREGIPQLKTLDPYSKVEAETIAWNGGIDTIMQDPSMVDSNNLYVTSIENGDWISVSQADLGSTAPASFTVSVAGKRGGIIELRADSPDPSSSKSKLIASLTVDAGDGLTWMVEGVQISSDISGKQDLFLVFVGDANHTELFDLDWWQLGKEEVDSNIKDDIESDEERSDEKDVSVDVTPNLSEDYDDSDTSEAGDGKIQADGKITTGLLVGMVVAIVLIVVGLVYLLRRRKLR
jgi:arabinoxylan arabinofuranohydrolase